MKDIFIDDLREEFVSDYVFPMFRCTAAGSSHASSSNCIAGYMRFIINPVRLQGSFPVVLCILPCE